MKMWVTQCDLLPTSLLWHRLHLGWAIAVCVMNELEQQEHVILKRQHNGRIDCVSLLATSLMWISWDSVQRFASWCRHRIILCILFIHILLFSLDYNIFEWFPSCGLCILQLLSLQGWFWQVIDLHELEEEWLAEGSSGLGPWICNWLRLKPWTSFVLVSENKAQMFFNSGLESHASCKLGILWRVVCTGQETKRTVKITWGSVGDGPKENTNHQEN